MRLKTNLVISVVFIALLGFVYFYEIRGGEDRRVEAERARQLLDFSEHEVRSLTIDHGDTLLVVERQGDVWRLTAPMQTDADGEAIERLLRALGEVELEGEPLRDSSSVAADPSILVGYGLDKPRLRVHVDLLEGVKPLDTLRFGDDTPTDRFTYVQRGGAANPEVLRVRAWRFDNLNKTIFDLRDRRVLAFESDDVRRFRLQHAGEPTIEASRATEGGWLLEAPLVRRGDASKINSILSSLQNAKTERILLEQPAPADLAAAGLADAVLELTLWIGEDRAEKHLLLGAATEKGSLQALDTSRPHVFLVDSTLVGQLQTPVAGLRDKQILHVEADDVTAVALQEGGNLLWSAARDSAGTWSLTTPSGRAAKSWRFSSLLADLDALEASRFAADAAAADRLPLATFGLDAPQWSIVVTRADGSMATLQVGARGDGEAFVMGDEALSISVVDDDAVEGLHLGLDDVSTPPTQDPDGADVDPAAAQ
ncbi:MAG: DUF4340 domain-containing protein [bacterium]|nr:DUF4340 domain-containing protein [bacterium]